MSANIASTSWPSALVPQPVRELLSHFFNLMGDSSHEAAIHLVNDVFDPKATLITTGGTFNGPADIRLSRAKAWEHIKFRYHCLDKVFSATDDGSDLLMIGSAVMVLKQNDIRLEGEFIGGAVIEGINTDNPKLTFFQAWGDSGPMIKAMTGA